MPDSDIPSGGTGGVSGHDTAAALTPYDKPNPLLRRRWCLTHSTDVECWPDSLVGFQGNSLGKIWRHQLTPPALFAAD